MLIAGTDTIAEGTTRHYIHPNLRRAARGVRDVLLERSFQLEIPEKVRRKAALMGETGLAWLANLQQHIVELKRRSAIKVKQPTRRGSEPLFLRRAPGVGLDVILKIVIRLRRSLRRHAAMAPKMAAPGRPYTSAIAARFR
jgi:hypothetical protein